MTNRASDPDSDPDSDDEAAAFADAMRGARALGGRSRVPAPAERGAGGGLPAAPSSPYGRAAPAAALVVEQAGSAWAARASGVDRRVLRKLRAGDPPVQAEIDLHGLTRVKAGEALARFLAAARAAGQRALLIVHGRGLHSGQDGPALPELVRDCLTRGPLAEGVLACGSAPADRGGAGATLVYLRR